VKYAAGLVAILALAAATPVLGRAEKASTPNCLNTAMTNLEFAECTGSIILSADARLNLVWQRLFKEEGGSKTSRGRVLLTEQRAWISFREKACQEFFLPGSGRESEVIHGPLCIADIIADRANQLEARLKQSDH
jgi:uncharacterized protein YecT (DUF1311 family)